MNGRLVATLLLAAVVAGAACGGGDDDAAPETTASPVTTERLVDTTPPAPTAAPTTEADEATTVPSTDPAPPTTTEEDLAAVIAAEFEAALRANYEGLVDPSPEALPDLLSAVVVPGSPAEAALTGFVNELVRLGDGIVPGDPDVLVITVEAIELNGSAPHQTALATVCLVENRRQVTLAKNAPGGVEIELRGSGDLQAVRQVYDVRLGPSGWRLWQTLSGEGTAWVGSDSCPSS